jgi:vitamin-K-epoxide reductase (warfarin-sensitive)
MSAYFLQMLQLTESTTFTIALSIVGILICLYAIDIEKSKKPKYARICDINDSMSCTIVLTSKYSHMVQLLFNLHPTHILNYSNAQYGLLFYTIILLLQFITIPHHNLIFFIMATSSLIASCGLAWILYNRLHNFCMICVCMYIINTLLTTSAIMRIINTIIDQFVYSL